MSVASLATLPLPLSFGVSQGNQLDLEIGMHVQWTAWTLGKSGEKIPIENWRGQTRRTELGYPPIQARLVTSILLRSYRTFRRVAGAKVGTRPKVP